VDEIEQMADPVAFLLSEQILRPGGLQVAEGWVVKAGGICHAATGELTEDLVDEAGLGGGVGAICEELGEQLLGGIAIVAD